MFRLPLQVSLVLYTLGTIGCASIVSGTGQTLSVDTPGCVGAKCELRNDKGVWYVPQTPGSVVVNRAYGNLLVTCSKGSKKNSASIQSSTKAMAFGNILFGGPIGGGIDVATGAAYDYPQQVLVPLDCSVKKK